MKKQYKIYLEQEDYDKLKTKAGSGRGSIAQYITKIAREPVVFLDSNARAMLEALRLNSGGKTNEK